MIKRIRPVTRAVKIEGEIQRLLNEALSGRRELLELQGGWAPPVDIYEKDEDIIVEAEVPGLSAREIVVSLHMSRIEIRGRKNESPIPERARYLRLEREYGKFQRTVPLPFAVHPDKARAYLENGILTVRLKKMKEKKDKNIVVEIKTTQD